MKGTEKISQENIVRADRRERRKRQDHHLLPAAFPLVGIERPVRLQKTPAKPRERPYQIREQNRPDALESPEPNEHGRDQEQESKEQYASCAEKYGVGFVFLQTQGDSFRVEHFLELAFERPVTIFS